MGKQVKQKSTLREFLDTLFGNEIFYNEDYIEVKDKELLAAQASVDNKGMETEEPIVSENNSSKNSGSTKKIEKVEVKERGINQEILNKMRENYEKAAQEIEDDEIIK